MNSAVGTSLTAMQETKIVALLARGDSYSDIARLFEAEEDRPLNVHTVSAVKRRNQATLDKIKTATLQKQVADAMQIKLKANNVISTQLDNLERNSLILQKAGVEYLAGDLSLKEYTEIAKRLKGASLPELVAVSKEMHAQTNGTPDAPINPAEQAALVSAMEAGDTVKLTQVLFKKGGDTQDDGISNPPSP